MFQTRGRETIPSEAARLFARHQMPGDSSNEEADNKGGTTRKCGSNRVLPWGASWMRFDRESRHGSKYGGTLEDSVVQSREELFKINQKPVWSKVVPSSDGSDCHPDAYN